MSDSASTLPGSVSRDLHAVIRASIAKANGLDLPEDVTIYHNLSYDDLRIHEESRNEGSFIANGTFAVDTGKFTGRSPGDKFFVKQSPSDEHLDWGPINQPCELAVFDELKAKCSSFLQEQPALYVFDGFVGHRDSSRRHVRFVSTYAWQHHFVTNMFVRVSPAEARELAAEIPKFTIWNCCDVVDEDWKAHGLNSEVFVLFNMESQLAVIGGTEYGGEMKKGIFSLINYEGPLAGNLTMHCSANVGKEDSDVAIFFGLSGTGKTTLSSDPARLLIGDDEHIWDDEGVSNLEGGCYAKTIGLKRESEPEIYDAIRPNAMLENVVIREDGSVDYDDSSKTANGRVSYPLEHIPAREPSACAGHPSVIILLTCDAYGVLPPVSRLSRDQTMYHFLSGYTAKVAGTERGVKEPQATFSHCFGAAFMPLHPTKYAELLGQKMERHNTRAYLVNTGWSGGAYGVGSRMPIKVTRACVNAILSGEVESAEFEKNEIFGLEFPVSLPGVPDGMTCARGQWADKDAYDAKAKELAAAFKDNYKKYQVPGVKDYSPAGPQ